MYESSLLHIFYNIQKYTIIPSFTKRFEIVVAATLRKNLGFPMPKRSNNSYLQENEEHSLQCTHTLFIQCTLSMTCKIDVVNKQLVPPLN